MKKNIALFDSSKEEANDFISGLECETGEKWELLVANCNKGRNFLYNIYRYFMYFLIPFIIFLKRKKYKNIIGWQAFYGLNYAFFSNLFKVKKSNFLLIKNFTYKPKKGIVSKIYEMYMNFIVESDYVDIFICTSKTMVNYCSKRFPNRKDKFKSLPFGVNDFTKKISENTLEKKDFVLSLGRSNRDWSFLINAFKKIDKELIIICDTLKISNLPKNITILNNVWKEESYKYINNCKCMVIPIDDGEVASGETVLLQSFSFSKPVIITKPSCLATDYVEDNINGLIINKNIKDLEKAIYEVYENETKYLNMCNNARLSYDEKYSLKNYGKNIGKIISDFENNRS